MVTVDAILEIAASAGYQFLGGVRGQRSGYALAHLYSDYPVTICKTLDEVLEFLITHQERDVN